jgi:phosphotransferase system enzyme I (PtsI)
VERIRSEKANAEWVVHRTTEELVEKFNRLDDARLRERADDLRDVGRYLLRMLQGIAHHELADLEEDVVIVADDLTPSDAVRLGRQRVIGLAVESGGRTSHTTIIARSLNIPLVTGLQGVVDRVTDEDPVIVDGERGTFILHPTAEQLADYAARRDQLGAEEVIHLATRELAARSLDGVEVVLQANIDLPEEIEEGDALRCLRRRPVPQRIPVHRDEPAPADGGRSLPDLPAARRTGGARIRRSSALTTSADASWRAKVMDTREDNPVLGLRGIRLTLARPQVFRTQLRGLFRAGLHGDIWVMLPLVSAVEEVRKFRAFADEVTAGAHRGGHSLPPGHQDRRHARGALGGDDHRPAGAARWTSSRWAPTTSSSTRWPSIATTST